MVQVIATKQGHDGVRLREPGDVFEMPESCFEPVVLDAQGKQIGTRPVPSWFEKVSAPERAQKTDTGGKGGKGKGDDLT